MAAAMKRQSALLLLALPVCLEACASTGSYPSLAKREAERVTGTEEQAAPAAPEPETPPSAALEANVEQLLDQATSAHGEFEKGRESTQRTVSAAKGSAVASEKWVAAEVALATLESARSGAITALSEIDQLYADERVAKPRTVTPSAKLLGSAREQVRALVQEENDTLGEIASQMGG